MANRVMVKFERQYTMALRDALRAFAYSTPFIIIHQQERTLTMLISESLWEKLQRRIDRVRRRIAKDPEVKPENHEIVMSYKIISHREMYHDFIIRVGVASSFALTNTIAALSDIAIIQSRDTYSILTLPASIWRDFRPLLEVPHNVMTRLGRKSS